MKNTPESEEMLLADADVGQLRGLWGVAVDGYVWDEKLGAIPPVAKNKKPRRHDRGPWLRPANSAPNSIARVYPVLRKPRVLTDFFALSDDPTLDRIRIFANKWGMLTTGEMRSGRHLTNGWITAESHWDWQVALLDFRILWQTWVAVRTLLHGDSQPTVAQRDAWRLLRRRIRWRNGNASVGYQADQADGGVRMKLIAAAGYREELLEDFRSGDLVGPARYYVHRELTERLSGKVNLVVGFTGGSFNDTLIRYSPSDLHTAIYVHFALDVAGAQRYERVCESCGHPFLPGRKDQRFCGKACRERAGYHRRKKGVGNGEAG
jgi:hypothetical protein